MILLPVTMKGCHIQDQLSSKQHMASRDLMILSKLKLFRISAGNIWYVSNFFCGFFSFLLMTFRNNCQISSWNFHSEKVIFWHGKTTTSGKKWKFSWFDEIIRKKNKTVVCTYLGMRNSPELFLRRVCFSGSCNYKSRLSRLWFATRTEHRAVSLTQSAANKMFCLTEIWL